MSTNVKPQGFVVLESCEDYEQILALNTAKELPSGGILTWSDRRRLIRAVFPTRKAARAAIERTEHYRLAYADGSLPQKQDCRIEPIGAVQEPKP